MSLPNTESQQFVRLNSVDHFGREIDPEILAAAEVIAARAIPYAVSLIGCPAQATSLLEEAAATVSRAVRRRTAAGKPAVTNLEAYLFRAFLRRVSAARRREVGPRLVERDIASNDAGSSNHLEARVLIDEFLSHCDPVTREMFHRRIAGFSWEEIGKTYKITAHAAESRFSWRLNQVRRKLGFK